MGNVFVISDLHFGHTNMSAHRGFATIEEHDAYIIERWNSVVKKGDTVWVLGDISMEKASEYHKLGFLNGYKKIVLGNHDLCKKSHNQEMLKYVNAISSASVNKKPKYILTHIPIHPRELGFFGVNIHGHIHENKICDDRYINVSCEAIEYTPILINDILNRKT